MTRSERIRLSKPGHGYLSWASRLLVALALTLGAPEVFADPPARVARLSVVSGEIAFAPAGDDNWHEADLNRPLVAGDRVYTERDARTELDLGSAALRLDERSELQLQQFNDYVARVDLPEGTLNLTVRNLYERQHYEIATPTLTLVVRESGAYRVDAHDGSVQVTAFDGAAEVYGADDAYQRVTARSSYRFADNTLRDADVFELPNPDDFDTWCFARDERYRNPVARRYVSEEVIGYADLDEYGDWREEAGYGPVWYPRHVTYEWAPYRDGHWAWVEPWGWTWVDNAPWGFAPSHYGRWVCVRERWGWIPGPRPVRPVYAPALVAFIGGDHWSTGYTQGARPVGWYPLGPRDVYEPPYRVSRDYFHNVNVTNIHNHTVINQTVINNVYNDYANGRPRHGMRHTHRDNPRAVTAVARDTFVNAQPVAHARKRLKPEDLRHTMVVARPDAQPTQASRAPRLKATQPQRPARSLKHDVIQRERSAADAKPNVSRPLEQRGQTQSEPRARKAPPVTATPAQKAPKPAPMIQQPGSRAPQRADHASYADTRYLVQQTQKQAATDIRKARPTRPPATSPVLRPLPVQPRVKTVQETRQPKPAPTSAHNERRVYTPPAKARRSADRQTQTERQQQISFATPMSREEEAQNPRAKARERQHTKAEEARQGIARRPDTVMMLR